MNSMSLVEPSRSCRYLKRVWFQLATSLNGTITANKGFGLRFGCLARGFRVASTNAARVTRFEAKVIGTLSIMKDSIVLTEYIVPRSCNSYETKDWGFD
jgi:hypothetical protein